MNLSICSTRDVICSLDRKRARSIASSYARKLSIFPSPGFSYPWKVLETFVFILRSIDGNPVRHLTSTYRIPTRPLYPAVAYSSCAVELVSRVFTVMEERICIPYIHQATADESGSGGSVSADESKEERKRTSALRSFFGLHFK